MHGQAFIGTDEMRNYDILWTSANGHASIDMSGRYHAESTKALIEMCEQELLDECENTQGRYEVKSGTWTVNGEHYES